MVLALVIAREALLAGYRLVRSDDHMARVKDGPWYTAVRVIEVVVTVGAPDILHPDRRDR